MLTSAGIGNSSVGFHKVHGKCKPVCIVLAELVLVGNSLVHGTRQSCSDRMQHPLCTGGDVMSALH